MSTWQTIEQLDAPLKDSREGVEWEEVVVRDPRHPLFGRQFRVARRPVEPERKGRCVLVLYRNGILLRIPEAVTRPRTVSSVPTKLDLDSVRAIVEVARVFDLESMGAPEPTDS